MALAESLDTPLATQADVLRLEAKMDARFERIDGELKLNRWMLGILLGGVITLILKSFF